MAKILFFGRLTDLTGTDETTLDLPASVNDTGSLREWLDSELDTQGVLLEPTTRIALNAQIVPEASPVSNIDEIAFMPPVGGG